MKSAPSVLRMLEHLKWLDGSPLLRHMEAYRVALFRQFFDEHDADGHHRYNLLLAGRGKKNWKTADLCLASLCAVMEDSVSGSQCYILANDKDQAADDLTLLKKLIAANGFLGDFLKVRKDIIERTDGNGFIETLPAGDISGSHGKTYRLCGFDEVHGYRTWDLLEAMQFDPTRRDSQQWITSYASIYHRPGVPLFDLMAAGKTGADPRMVFSWFGADFCTDPNFANATPEARANPSAGSWADPNYLEQQQRRLPAHAYRRLHLNLPGLPAGSAFQAEPVMDAIDRGVRSRLPVVGTSYVGFVDMSGGSSDDACLAIAHRDADGRAVLDLVMSQGQPCPFDPRLAVERFASVLSDYRCTRVVGDRYGGETFRMDFSGHHVSYQVSDMTTSQLYDALEPKLNAGEVVLLDSPMLEQQLLGLVWRGGKITHQGGEHDDWACAVAGAIHLTAHGVRDERAAAVARACFAEGASYRPREYRDSAGLRTRPYAVTGYAGRDEGDE